MQNLADQLEPPVPQEEIEAANPPAEAKTEEPKVEVPKEEPKAEEKADEPKAEKLVRLEALHEERAKRKEAQRELEAFRQKQAQLEGRLQQILEAQKPQTQAIDPNADPWGAMVQKQEMTAHELAQLRAHHQQQQEAQHRQAAKAELVGWYQGQAEEFKSEQQDFMDAYSYVRQRRVGELQALGHNPLDIAQILENDELWVAHTARQRNQNPAELLYKVAKAQGYTGKKEIPAQEKIQTLQKGNEAAKSLGSGSSSGDPTPEQIANMSESEFAEFKAKLAKKGKRLSDAL